VTHASRKTPALLAAEAEIKRLKDANGVLLRALTLMSRGSTDAKETVHVGKDTYVLRLYGAKGFDGGTVVETFVCEGQEPTVSVARLDEKVYPPLSEYLPHRIAVDKLKDARRRLLDLDATWKQIKHGPGGAPGTK